MRRDGLSILSNGKVHSDNRSGKYCLRGTLIKSVCENLGVIISIDVLKNLKSCFSISR